MISIGSVLLDCRVSVDHPAAAAVARRCADAVERELPGALDRVARPFDADPAVVLLRRIEVDLTVSADGRPEELGRALASLIWDRVLGAPPGDEVVRFASPVERLARFLDDVVAGTAWQRWYHRDLAGLALVPTGQILRTLAASRRADLAAALELVPRSTFEQLRSVAARRADDGLAAVFATVRHLEPGQGHLHDVADAAGSPSTSNEARPVRTAMGGAVLLLPALIDEPLLSSAGAALLRRRTIELALDCEIADADPVLALLDDVDGDGDGDGGAGSTPNLEHRAETLAAAILRAFARSIMGSGDSTDGYLREQFLDVPATLVDVDLEASGALPATAGGVRWIVVVDDPPMSVLLRLSGYGSRRFVLPWAGERLVHLSLGAA